MEGNRVPHAEDRWTNPFVRQCAAPRVTVEAWTALGWTAGRRQLDQAREPRRAVRSARLIHAARPRSWRTCGARRVRRHL
jgi:hypothetical protein